MKKLKIITITAIIYIGLILVSTQVYASSIGKTINETTRMREKATTSSSTVTLISINQEVEIISQEGEWYKVKYTSEGKTYSGYIRNDMLKTDKNETIKKEEVEKDNKNEENTVESTEVEENVENTQEFELTEGTTSNTKNKLKVRILPLINSNKVGSINKNSKITISEILGNWAYIEAKNQSGWVIINELRNSLTTQTSNKEEIKTEKPEKEEVVDKKEETTVKENKTEIKPEKQTLYVSSQTVNLRKEANSTSTILKQLSRNTKVTVIEKVNNTWSKVEVDGITGYISSTYLSENKKEVTSRGSETSREEKVEEEKQEENKKTETAKKEDTTKTENKKEETKQPVKTETTKKEETSKKENTKKPTKQEETKKEDKKESSKVTGSDIVSYAKKYLGYKYVLGAASPKAGFDCSGLTSYVYKQNGYTLNRTSSAQSSNGKKVSKSNLKAGDLVFFSQGSKRIGHVGIYIGGGNFIHAANPRKGVIITSLSNSYYAKRYVTARRIIN